MPKYSTEALRNFYFSGATNFNNFAKKADTSAAQQSFQLSPTTSTVEAKDVQRPASTSLADTTAATVSADATGQQLAATSDKTVSTKSKKPAGSGVQAVKQQQQQAPPAASTSAGNNSVESVSPEYVTFLRQQQDLIKGHTKVDEILALAHAHCTERRAEVEQGVETLSQLLAAAEASANWNWKSKYALETLVSDAQLEVPLNQLHAPEDIPVVVELQYQQQQLVRLKQIYGVKEQHSNYKLILDNGVRRMDRLVKEVSNSQFDGTPVVRLSDNLLVQLDHILNQPTLQQAVQEVDDALAVLGGKQKECLGLRDQAQDDGEMHVAERETFRLVDLYEELVAAQLQKIALLSRISEETTVGNNVREQYTKKADDDCAALTTEAQSLKSRSEQDLARLYKLKSSVDDAEQRMQTKWKTDRAASDDKLRNIAQKQSDAWAQIEQLLGVLRQLENERHLETKKRVDDKIKDEARNNEYAMFTAIATKHAALLDNTIKNCDTKIHCLQLMNEYLHSGFGAVKKDLDEKQEAVDAALLDAHKQHLELFRGLYFTLGDLEHRKEKRVEEVGASIQAAHIQQEMCSDSLNPNAKKFSDAKKELLRLRDELMREVDEIRKRGLSAAAAYERSEEALVAAGYEHVHPLAEQEERRLALRAKMVEYKSLSLGLVSSQPVREELEALKRSINANRSTLVKSSNTSRTE